MKWLLVFGLIAIISNAPETLADSNEDSGSSSDSDSSSSSKNTKSSAPVKIVKVQPLKSNSEYFGKECSMRLKEINKSYNAVKLNLIVKKDLPSDTKVVVKIYQSSSLDGTYKTVGRGCSFGLSETGHEYHKYLPRELIKHVKSSGTLRKGNYASEDFGYFKFYKLLTKKELQHQYFKVIYNYECKGEILFSVDERFQSLSKK